MRYISSMICSGEELEFGGGFASERVPGGGYPYSLVNWASSHVTVSDTCVGGVFGLGGIGSVLGVGLDAPDRWVMLTHTKKTALLHQYIDHVDGRVAEPPEGLTGADIGYFYTMGYDTVVDLENSKHDVLDIRLHDHQLSIFGPLGSIVYWHDSEFSAGGYVRFVSTLYDFLIYMCRMAQRNLMQYHRIQFGSVSHEWRINLYFRHTVEAERFYMKMYLDALSDNYKLTSPTFNCY